MNNFRVGQKVVCINSSRCDRLTDGLIYTVSKVWNWPSFSHLDGETVMSGINLVEVEAEHDAFDARRFRPVVEPGTETGMSILRELLNTQDKPVEVDA